MSFLHLNGKNIKLKKLLNSTLLLVVVKFLVSWGWVIVWLMPRWVLFYTNLPKESRVNTNSTYIIASVLLRGPHHFRFKAWLLYILATTHRRRMQNIGKLVNSWFSLVADCDYNICRWCRNADRRRKHKGLKNSQPLARGGELGIVEEESSKKWSWKCIDMVEISKIFRRRLSAQQALNFD